MTKSELKPGYVVRYKNGETRMVMQTETEIVLVQMEQANPFWSSLNGYDEDLTCQYADEFTIVEVYGHNRFTTTIWTFNPEHRKLLWKRHEKKQYTYAQLRKILGEEFEVIG